MPIIAHLIADRFGSHIGKYQERLKLTHKGEDIVKAPLIHLEAVFILSMGVSISVDAIQACCEIGIPIHMLDGYGAPYASLYASGLGGTVVTRREQLRAYDDLRGFHLAVQFARGKLANQAKTLRYFAKTRKDTPIGEELKRVSLELQDSLARLDGLNPACLSDELRAYIMGVEGDAAHRYWQAVGLLLPESYGWTGRKTRGATDAVNSLLNYGYGILYAQIERALVLAGLDPYAGFLHADRPGKLSLVLDLIEEFRQVVVDRVVVGLAARNFTVERDDVGMMTDVTRKTYAEHVLSHLEATVRYEGNRHALRHIIQMQARQLASFLRGERTSYEPFRTE